MLSEWIWYMEFFSETVHFKLKTSSLNKSLNNKKWDWLKMEDIQIVEDALVLHSSGLFSSSVLLRRRGTTKKT